MKRSIGFVVLALLAGVALAQQPYRANGETRLVSVSTAASLPVQILPFSSDQLCQQVTLANTGGIDAWIELASTSGAAVPDIPAAGNPGTSVLLRAGTTADLATANRPYLSAKTASSSTTVTAVCSQGETRGVTGILLGTGASATQVQGTAADGAAAVGSPVQVGGKDTSGNLQAIATDSSGNIALANNAGALSDNAGNSPTSLSDANGTRFTGLSYNFVFDGSAWDRMVGDSANGTKVYSGAPAAADILAGAATATSTTASTALITVTANRTWQGQVCVSVHGTKAAAVTGNGEVLGSILTAGTNVTPAAGTYFQVDTGIGANAATGVVGTQGSNQGCTAMTVVAPVGNTVTVNYAATCTNTTACRVSANANGRMF